MHGDGDLMAGTLGIGLPLTLELAKFHKGTVRLESVVGQGSTFRLVLPLGSGHLPSTSIMDDNAQTHTPSDDSTTAVCYGSQLCPASHRS